MRVEVRNGTGTPGEAAATAEALRAAGFPIAGTGDAAELGVPRTEIHHPLGEGVAADLLARWLVNGARLVEDSEVADITLVTGADFDGLRTEPRRAPPTSSSSTTLPRASTTTEPGSSSTTIRGTIPTETTDARRCG